MKNSIAIILIVLFWIAVYGALLHIVWTDPDRHQCGLCKGDSTLAQCRTYHCENTF